MKSREYVIGWNDVRNGLMSNLNDAYCTAVSVSAPNTEYGDGCLDCVAWYRKNLTIPARLSWKDPNGERWNDVSNSDGEK